MKAIYNLLTRLKMLIESILVGLNDYTKRLKEWTKKKSS